MIRLHDWLATRTPAPPEAVGAALRALSVVRQPHGSAGEADAADQVARVDALATAARACLDQALTRPSERGSAFRLLEADALFTYACEGALEVDDPVDALRRILTVAGR